MLDAKKARLWTLIAVLLQIIGITISFQSNNILIGIVMILILIITSFWMVNLYLKVEYGDYLEGIDLSVVETEKVSIPATIDGKKGFIYAMIYRDKSSLLDEKKPYIIAAHGARGKYKDIELFSVPLALNGFHVIAFNQSGCGTEGEISIGDKHSYVHAMTNIHDVVNYVKTLPDLKPKEKNASHENIGFIGHSTGGIMALSQAYVNEDIKMVVSMAGVHDFKAAVERKYPVFSSSWWFRLGLKLSGMKINYTDEENYFISPKYCLQFVEENKKRVFIVHAEDDPIPIDESWQSQRLAGVGDKNCLYLSRGGHIFRRQETLVVSKVINWFKDYL